MPHGIRHGVCIYIINTTGATCDSGCVHPFFKADIISCVCAICFVQSNVFYVPLFYFFPFFLLINDYLEYIENKPVLFYVKDNVIFLIGMEIMFNLSLQDEHVLWCFYFFLKTVWIKLLLRFSEFFPSVIFSYYFRHKLATIGNSITKQLFSYIHGKSMTKLKTGTNIEINILIFMQWWKVGSRITIFVAYILSSLKTNMIFHFFFGFVSNWEPLCEIKGSI